MLIGDSSPFQIKNLSQRIPLDRFMHQGRSRMARAKANICNSRENRLSKSLLKYGPSVVICLLDAFQESDDLRDLRQP